MTEPTLYNVSSKFAIFSFNSYISALSKSVYLIWDLSDWFSVVKLVIFSYNERKAFWIPWAVLKSNSSIFILF